MSYDTLDPKDFEVLKKNNQLYPVTTFTLTNEVLEPELIE